MYKFANLMIFMNLLCIYKYTFHGRIKVNVTFKHINKYPHAAADWRHPFDFVIRDLPQHASHHLYSTVTPRENTQII